MCVRRLGDMRVRRFGTTQQSGPQLGSAEGRYLVRSVSCSRRRTRRHRRPAVLLVPRSCPSQCRLRACLRAGSRSHRAGSCHCCSHWGIASEPSGSVAPTPQMRLPSYLTAMCLILRPGVVMRHHDYGLGSPGAVGDTSGADSGCVGGGGGIRCGAGVSPGCGAISPAGGIPSVGSVGALQNPTGSM